ncbi:class I adenylate-forming enzyme family protein [Gracilimonas sp.]|uniref:class I adenylate-forming enzyme family protein n=1 Tax=Gracilimonas sp. TaxID=1974203 RepID=UPI002872402E|nr:class I adenylate-forming enzyme family protein [Gracilimonas sp.]
MEFRNLEEKITHARSLNNPLPELVVDFKSLLKRGIGSGKVYLTYRDAEHNRTDVSYREFYKYVLNTARFYQSKGLQQGDKIATISHNHWHTVVQYFAAWFCGLVVVPVNLGEDDNRIAYILENAEVKLALVRDEYTGRIQSIINKEIALSEVEVVGCDDDVACFSEKDGVLDDPKVDLESEALIVFTSGTTGSPKGVVLTQRNLLEDARTISQWHNIDGQTKMMCVLPIHHVNGTVVTMITPFYAGGSTVLNQKFSASHFFEAVENEGVHVVSVVPTLLQYLTNYYADKEAPGISHFRHIICGAGPLTVQVVQNFEEKFDIPIIHGYGLSETTCYSCFIPVDQPREEHYKWMRDFGYPSIGIPVPANEMDIQDEQGNSVPEGERGEIVIRGVNVMKEYFNNREANESAFKNGWFRSGDEGFIKKDEEGNPYFFITGRLKELIIRGGINLAPLEIDEVINKAPGVKAGIAVGFENDWYGEEVGAYVQLKEEAKEDKQAILDYCQKHLPFSKAPKVVVVGEELPVTSTGKYQRLKVAHLFEEWKKVQFKK